MQEVVQGELFDGKPRQLVPNADLCASRHRGADTSVEAFQTTHSCVRSRQRDSILDFVRQRGSYGATCEEIEDALHLQHQTASARVTELAGLHLIAFGADRRRTKHNKSARVYRVASQESKGGEA